MKNQMIIIVMDYTHKNFTIILYQYPNKTFKLDVTKSTIFYATNIEKFPKSKMFTKQTKKLDKCGLYCKLSTDTYTEMKALKIDYSIVCNKSECLRLQSDVHTTFVCLHRMSTKILYATA
ncbi:hypothetical protein EWB00_010276 [Schistosoma japonicum]|uniref:Uncharacterized protein n=1 Tax=Schistosoma japonicum TaxID=6182 RepID=A0A4Z2DPC1_SCHJA|nr:hypothetical protein EWB00_010276 [Schistosoma japonicum]